MRDVNEIMDELQGLDGYDPSLAPVRPRHLSWVSSLLTSSAYSELKNFSPEAHWFCPKRNDDDHIDYDNPAEPEEDMSPETKLELIEDAKYRHKVAYKYSLILGLAPEVSGVLLEDYTQRLNKLLTGCDKCVHQWHMGRKTYLKELAEYVIMFPRRSSF